jgi:hypothetical protein
MRAMFAFEVDAKIADAVHPVFVDPINEIDHARLFEKPRHGVDAGEQPAQLAVLLADLLHVLGQLLGVEVFLVFHLQRAANRAFRDDFVAFDKRLPDLVPRAFVDVVLQVGLRLVLGERDLMFNFDVEEAEAAVVIVQRLDVVRNRCGIVFPADQPGNLFLRDQLQPQDLVAEIFVADEIDGGDFDLRPLVDAKDDVAVVLLVALLEFDRGEGMAFLVVHLLDPAGAFLVAGNVVGAAFLQTSQLFELLDFVFGETPLDAELLHAVRFLEAEIRHRMHDRPFDHAEHQFGAVVGLADVRLDDGEPPRANEGVDIFANLFPRRRAAGSRLDVPGDVRAGDRLIPFDAHRGERFTQRFFRFRLARQIRGSECAEGQQQTAPDETIDVPPASRRRGASTCRADRS